MRPASTWSRAAISRSARNATVNGDGVVFYLADGVNLNFNGNAIDHPVGADHRRLRGITGLRQPRPRRRPSHSINGNFGSTSINGAVYPPASHLTWSGNAQTSFTGCTQVIADTVSFEGSGSISLNCVFPHRSDDPDGR